MKKIILAAVMATLLLPTFTFAQDLERVSVTIQNISKYKIIKVFKRPHTRFSFINPFSTVVVEFKGHNNSSSMDTLDLFAVGIADEPLGYCRVHATFIDHQPFLKVEDVAEKRNPDDHYISCKLVGKYVEISPVNR